MKESFEKKKVIGKYQERTKRVFSVNEVLHIKTSIAKGTTIKKLAERYKVDHRVISKIFSEFKSSVGITRFEARMSKLGYKDEPYYEKESEMLEEPNYTWESLSEAEKKWYLDRKKPVKSKPSS